MMLGFHFQHTTNESHGVNCYKDNLHHRIRGLQSGTHQFCNCFETG